MQKTINNEARGWFKEPHPYFPQTYGRLHRVSDSAILGATVSQRLDISECPGLARIRLSELLKAVPQQLLYHKMQAWVRRVQAHSAFTQWGMPRGGPWRY
jgi:hypothetical protein